MPVLPHVIPVKTGIHASDPARGAGTHASNPPVIPLSFPRIIPPVSPRIMPPVIPVKTGIHASNPDHGAGIRKCHT